MYIPYVLFKCTILVGYSQGFEAKIVIHSDGFPCFPHELDWLAKQLQFNDKKGFWYTMYKNVNLNKNCLKENVLWQNGKQPV